MRWSVEVTFEEARAHLGFNTQRQWNSLAVARTSPAILGLFSCVTLLAQRLLAAQPVPLRSTAWYVKRHATFSDLLAFVRLDLWQPIDFPRSRFSPHSVIIPASLFDLWIETLSSTA